MLKIVSEFPFQLSNGQWVEIRATCDRVYNWEAEGLTLEFFDPDDHSHLPVVYDADVFAEIEYEAIHWLLYEKDNGPDAANNAIVNELKEG